MNGTSKGLVILFLIIAGNYIYNSIKISKIKKMETLEETWNIISRGMQETQQIEEQNKREREESRKRMATLTENIKKELQG